MAGATKLSSILRQISGLYRELIKIHISPAHADEHELWQLGALMGEDTPNPNDPDEINNRIIAERYRAAREGRELDAESLLGGMSEDQVQAIGHSLDQDTGRL